MKAGIGFSIGHENISGEAVKKSPTIEATAYISERVDGDVRVFFK